MMNLEIIQAVNKEIKEILLMMKDFYEFENIHFNENNLTKLLNEILLSNNQKGYIFKFTTNNIILGYSIVTIGFSLEYQGNYFLIDELYIKPDYRNKGIASKFLEFIKNFAFTKNIHYILLEVDDFNKNAYNLYLKNGFVDKKRNLLRCNIF
ncbi:MAG TPA: GNAT family N-acetyltransferase [Ignavibacteriales bacterium]|nr:GNAT family N-acetyltransferase [Ignavibacteriales bacterium]HOM65823.1 GNAT family N-acetyltransferase [Ignavibacteriales bacterium]HPD67074.1 GNAT family N-acetyltransferase [Ignavibacteriales bacterium]HRR18988.1 GNAT family N-acetyltransferase [Ignavibacteriales bacterium]HRT99205.1 GNAT family N-acetyltransferase [Ignavibacteriales bacterium]